MPSVTLGVATDTRTTFHCNVAVAQLTFSSNASLGRNKENDPPAQTTLADGIKQRSRGASGPVQKPPQLIPMATPQESAAAVGHRLSKQFAEAGEAQKPSRRRKDDRGDPIAILDEADGGSHRPTEPRGYTAADYSAASTSTTTEIRPINDTAYYRDFAAQVVKALQQRHKPRPKCFGDRQNERILDLLRYSTPANDEEMLFLSGGEAAELFRPGSFHNGPLLTEGQQPIPLQSITDFLGEYYDEAEAVIEFLKLKAEFMAMTAREEA